MGEKVLVGMALLGLLVVCVVVAEFLAAVISSLP